MDEKEFESKKPMHLAIGRCAGLSLATSTNRDEEGDSGNEDSGAHQSPSLYSHRSRDAVAEILPGLRPGASSSS